MSLSHRKQPDGGDRYDGDLGTTRFMVIFDASGKVVRGERTVVEAPAPKPKAPAQPKLTLWEMLTGSRSLVKAHAGIDPVDDETYHERRRTCLACVNYDFGVCGGEKGCGCYLAAKIRLKGEKCPIGKW